jgi:hypothetical protein
MSKSKEYIVVRENLLPSILMDISTFGSLLGGFYLNYRFIGNNSILAAILTICFVIQVFSLAVRGSHFTDKDKLIKALQDDKL